METHHSLLAACFPDKNPLAQDIIESHYVNLQHLEKELAFQISLNSEPIWTLSVFFIVYRRQRDNLGIIPDGMLEIPFDFVQKEA